jgi:hypothetical protein
VRSPEELHSAIEAMFRIRAVESPPDGDGHRHIWHRGARGAELVTELDGLGRIVQQDFTLFGESARWDREGGIRAAGPDGAEGSRLDRLRGAIAPYRGSDRFILHLRAVLGAEEPPAPRETPPAAAGPEALAVVATASRGARWGAWAVGLLLAALAVALLLARGRG